ncbi:MAG: glycosyltransferase [Planctomycetota bacterium]
MDQPRVSIVIVTADRCGDLRRCLGELRTHVDKEQTLSVEVLTVHAPHDGLSMAMVREEYPWVAVHVAAARHIGRQRNLGAQKANGDVLVYLDDDAWPRPGWLRELIAAFDDARVVAASGPVFRGDGSLQCERLAASPLGRIVPVKGSAPTPRGMSPTFSGCNLAISRRALFACGGFDENLVYQPDDMDMCCRLFAAAGRSANAMCYRPHAAVNHESSPGPFRRNLQDRAWFTVARDNVYFGFKHAGAVRALLCAGLLQVPKLARFFMWMVRGRLGPLACLRCVVKHLSGTLAGHAKGLCRRAALPLRPLPPAAVTTTSAPSAMPCRPPQPV